MKIGIHVSIAGGLHRAADRAHKLGVATMQLFTKNPRAWKARALKQEDIEKLNRKRRQYAIDPLVVHISYLPNLAAEKEELYHRSKKALLEELQRSHTIGADHLILHPGHNEHRKQGMRRIASALYEALEQTPPSVTVLLENTAGGKNSIGGDFLEIQEMIASVEELGGQIERLGLCLDTCHACAFGYDLRREEGLEMMLGRLKSTIGLERLHVIHANDSRFACGSKKDRHEHIGQGHIGEEGFKRICNHPDLRQRPFVMETPGDRKDDRRNVKTLRSYFARETGNEDMESG